MIIDFGMARTADQAATKVAWGGTPGRLSTGWKGGWTNPQKPVVLR